MACVAYLRKNYDAGFTAAGGCGTGSVPPPGVGGTGNSAGFSVSGTGGSSEPAPGVVAPGRSGKVGSWSGMGMKPSSPVRIFGFWLRRARSGASGPT